MPETFKTKVRNVGTSFGILIPSNIIKNERIRVGKEVEVTLIKPRSTKEIEKIISEAFGSAKGAKAFRREHRDHVFK